MGSRGTLGDDELNFDDNIILQDIQVQDQPIGYNFNAPLPTGETNIRTRLYCTGSLRRQSYSETRHSDRAQGGLRPSMTIVFPPID
eukprot:9500075-Pyramimonas_sp.AAC.1